MAELRPLRALRYDFSRFADPGSVLAPPFDQIGERDREALYARSPWNIVRLERARPERGDDEKRNAYTRAAATLADWMREGVLVHDAAARFFVLEQEFAHAGRRIVRKALFGRVRVEPWEAAVVRPHETTLAAPKEDRLRLLRAIGVQVSPIFALFPDGDGSIRETVDASVGDPLVQPTDATGHRHRLRAIDDTDAHAKLAQLFERRSLTIADGHHRYETAIAWLRERKSNASRWTGSEPENFVMMGLVAVEDPGLVVLPFHRMVRPNPPSDLLGRLREAFAIVETSARDPRAMVALLSEAGRKGPAIGLYTRDAFRLLLPKSAGMPGTPTLDVDLLHAGVLEPVLGIAADAVAHGGEVEFTMDDAEAVRGVDEGRFPLAFLLNPTPARAVLEAADAGRRMPPKSTAFYPKLPTGLVLNPVGAIA